jgi:ABC-type phosphate/phosphonate transport system substrate-binding protein
MASAFIATVCSALLLALWLLFLVNQEKDKQSILVEQVRKTVRANGVLLQRTLGRIDENLESIWANREKRFIDLDSEDVAMLGGEAKSFVTNKATAVRWKMGLITDEYPAHRVRQHAKLLSELESRSAATLGREIRIDVRLYKFHDDFVKDLLSGGVDFGRMGALRYLRTRRVRPDLIPLTVPKTSFKLGLLFTRTNAGIRSLEDIIGRRVAFGETNSTISYWAQIRLAEHGITGEKLAGHEFLDSTLDFADEVVEIGFSNALQRIGYLHGHAQVVEGVLEGRFDVGVAMRRAFLIHQPRGLAAIPGSEFVSSRNIHVARPGFESRFVDLLIEAMTSLQGHWLETLPDQSTGYERVSPKLYHTEESWLDDIVNQFRLAVPRRPR